MHALRCISSLFSCFTLRRAAAAADSGSGRSLLLLLPGGGAAAADGVVVAQGLGPGTMQGALHLLQAAGTVKQQWNAVDYNRCWEWYDANSVAGKTAGMCGS
jgi:hypothetical protein